MIGFGAIGEVVADGITAGRAGNARLVAVLEQRAREFHNGGHPFARDPTITFTDDAARFHAAQFDLAVEVAGQEALKSHALEVVQRGRDILVASVGAFTDQVFFDRLLQSAATHGARVLLTSGALPAADWMSAAALAGEGTVSITQSKPVESWRGTAATKMVDLDGLREATCFFESSAREAASQFPKSSNITAMLALSTVGFDDTKVRLVADPTSARMHTRIEFHSPVGSLRVEWQGVPLARSPSTSADVPLTIIKGIRNLCSTVYYGL
jgi:aspartate dehydrogenase